MPRDEIYRAAESAISKYSLPRKPCLACSLERIICMKYKSANPIKVRKIVHEILKKGRS